MNIRLVLVTLTLMSLGLGCTKSPSLDTTKFTEAAGPTNITVLDQEVTNGVLKIREAQFAQDVWVVVQADANGQPGPVVGRATYSGRALANLSIVLAAGTNSPLLHLSVHDDQGSRGQYEPDGIDKIITYEGKPVMTTINATYVGTSEVETVTDKDVVINPDQDPLDVGVQIDVKL